MRNGSKKYEVWSKILFFALAVFVLTSYSLLLTPALVRAQSVDILWQGETYTPPFYQGRPLWSKQSIITFVAIPQGLGNSANLNYKWTRNGTVLGNTNGIGRNYLSFADSVLSRPQTIKVEIVSGEEEILASASTTVIPTSPILAVYENNPLYGFMFHREAGDVQELKEREVTFAVFPLFFSAFEREDNILKYEWRTNAGGIETGDSVTYRTPENTAGSSRVTVRVSNISQIMQDANKNFLIQFGHENSN